MVGSERGREEAAERIEGQNSELVKLVTEGTRSPWRGLSQTQNETLKLNYAADYNVGQEMMAPWTVEREVQRGRMKWGVFISGPAAASA